MSLQFVANAELMTVSLGADYTAGSGTMTVGTGQGGLLPATGDFWIRQANVLASTAINILKVTARAGDVLTVVGGQDGTIDQNIADGTVMTWVLGVSAINQLIADILAASTKVIATYSPAAQAGSVASTNLATGLAAGLYRIDAYAQVTSTNASPAFVSIAVTHTYNGVAKSENVINSLNLGVANQEADSSNVVRVDAASTISFTITADAGAYLYSPLLKLSKIG